ncbi:MAG TPA: hypothetical protein VFJ63_01830 [Candidatus Bathyarchaeia archaeon]|nr:hypothetical protein [Candidatus Bathyarchaeia archaeon]
MLEARKKAADKLLQNCAALARYVSVSCSNVGRDILVQERTLRDELLTMNKTTDSSELHNWYKTRLIPLVKHSEAVAHVAATSSEKARDRDSPCYQWPVKRTLRG